MAEHIPHGLRVSEELNLYVNISHWLSHWHLDEF